MTSSGSCESWDIGNLLLNDLAFLRGLQDEIIPKSQNALHYQFIFLSDIQGKWVGYEYPLIVYDYA